MIAERITPEQCELMRELGEHVDTAHNFALNPQWTNYDSGNADFLTLQAEQRNADNGERFRGYVDVISRCTDQLEIQRPSLAVRMLCSKVRQYVGELNEVIEKPEYMVREAKSGRSQIMRLIALAKDEKMLSIPEDIRCEIASKRMDHARISRARWNDLPVFELAKSKDLRIIEKIWGDINDITYDVRSDVLQCLYIKTRNEYVAYALGFGASPYWFFRRAGVSSPSNEDLLSQALVKVVHTTNDTGVTDVAFEVPESERKLLASLQQHGFLAKSIIEDGLPTEDTYLMHYTSCQES